MMLGVKKLWKSINILLDSDSSVLASGQCGMLAHTAKNDCK